MGKFVIAPHMRLQEWVAEERGYFTQEGLDYEFVERSGSQRLSVKSAVDLPKDQIRGAYQTIEDGRTCDVSSACHWTINMSAAAGHGRLWAEAYSVTPGGVYVPADSAIRTADDLAGVPVTVGYQSGSHYATIQALEPCLSREQIRLHFGGMLFQRLELLVDGEVPAATMFGGPMYFVEQLGFRKIVDCSFMVATIVADTANDDDVVKYYRALKRAQQDIDLRLERYVHYYAREFPERFRHQMDTRRFGPGERIVFLPYTREIYEDTQRWVEQWNIFEGGLRDRKGYDDSTRHSPVL
jgi:hypothetical protein